MTYQEFREMSGDIDLATRGAQEAIFGLLDLEEGDRPEITDERSQHKADLWDYFQLFEKYPNADTDKEQEQALFDALDAFRDDLGTEREAALDADIGVEKQQIPLVKELRDEKRLIRQSKYWDIAEDAWTRVSKGNRYLPATKEEFEKELLLKGRNPATHPAMSRYRKALKNLRNQWLRKSPTNKRAIELVNKWYGYGVGGPEFFQSGYFGGPEEATYRTGGGEGYQGYQGKQGYQGYQP
jgi:hypothetical protein